MLYSENGTENNISQYRVDSLNYVKKIIALPIGEKILFELSTETGMVFGIFIIVHLFQRKR